MKKFILSLVTVGLAASSLAAYAALPTGATPFQVTVPNLAPGLEFMLEGLYLTPTNDNLVYATTTQVSGDMNNRSSYSINPNSDWGFKVGIGYILPNSGNDVQLNWTHLGNSTTTNSVMGAPNIGFFMAPAEDIIYTGAVTFKYDAVDLDMGQYFSMGTRFQARVFGGMRYARVQREMMTGDTVVENPALFSSQINTQKFDGLGPRLGIDTKYNVFKSLGVVAHFAGSFLISSVTQDITATVDNSVTTTNYNNQTYVVPGFDAKLGVDYSIPFNRKSTASMNIEAGWQVTEYFNAFTNNTTSNNGPTMKISAPVVTTTSVTNVGFQGPYLAVNFKI